MEPVYEVKVDGVAIATLWKNDNEHVKGGYKNLQKIKTEVVVEKAKNQVTVSFPKVKKLMQISINLPVQNCAPINTGYVRTSADNLTWQREPEDIARNQLKQAAPRGTEETFKFYFVAKEAKIVVFEIENSDACLLKATTASAIVLQDF